ncbi:hypothetical protein D3C81_930830 [compost metagenome]
MSQDVRMFVMCNHIINGEVLEESRCPRCYGKGYYFDIHFDEDGQTIISEKTLKLQQELLKITIEEKGENIFHPQWGDETRRRLIGSKNNPKAQNQIQVLVKDCIQYLQNVQIGNQTLFQNMTDEEIIATIDSINVIKSSQVGYEVQVTVTSQAGETINYAFSLEL